MDKPEALRIGVVGCGNHGGALAQAVVRSDNLRLLACADPDAAATQRVAALANGVSMHESLADLLVAADVDAVLIATPHDVLAPLGLSAIRAGKHLLIEKPMAMDEPQAREVEFAAASAGVTCMVGYSFRYGMARYVHDLLAQGTVGDLRAITGSIGTPRMNSSWIAQPESGGGPLLFVGCHLIDLALWFISEEPTSVWAAVQHRPDTGADDTSAIHLEFSDGRVAQFLVTQSAAGFFYDLRVIGRSGSMALRGRNFVQFEVEVHSTALGAYQEPTIIRPTMERDHITMMLMPELAEFADAIEHGRPPGVTASDGRRVLRVLDAVGESGRTHQATALDPPMLAAY
jgi:UDP-N-acetyl-2-amino-2-deoxyglucuronate dehydrogenase